MVSALYMKVEQMESAVFLVSFDSGVHEVTDDSHKDYEKEDMREI